MTATPADLAPDDAPRDRRVASVVIAVIFAALHGWFLYLALSNLVNAPAAYAAEGIADKTPWALLVTGVLLPVLFFALAAVLGRRHTLTNRVLLYAAGLAATSATALSLYAASAFLVVG